MFSSENFDPSEKISKTKSLFTESGSVEFTILEIKKYTNLAFTILKSLNISEKKKELLFEFGNSLMNRKI